MALATFAEATSSTEVGQRQRPSFSGVGVLFIPHAHDAAEAASYAILLGKRSLNARPAMPITEYVAK